ncbi:MAG: caspase family protein [Spirochaetota bacterium]
MQTVYYRRLRALMVLVIAVATHGINAQAQDPNAEIRLALIKGNGEYPNIPLKNPVNDARDLASALGNMGFAVNLVTDGDLAQMSRAIRDFGNSIRRPDAVALFYYSGHGVQFRGANYLIPARADILESDELPFMAINVDQVYAKMDSAGSRMNIIILDACRNNPFPGAERALERGLAVVGTIQPPQSLIVYATSPGKTAQDGEGRNGVFTSAFLKHLAAPGLDAELMIRRVREDVIAATSGNQIPWHNSSITGAGFSFAGGGRLYIASDPVGAEVFIDGQKRGVSPLALTDLPRFVEVEVAVRSGNLSSVKKLTLRDATETRLDLRLETGKGAILVKASEGGVQAFIDGAPVGLPPSGLIDGITTGRHDLELRGDSSSFKTSVEIETGATLALSAVLVPMADLTLALPADTVCSIIGMGISDTTSRFNYGSIPAGEYRLSVSGGDYEAYTETIRLQRGQKLNFSPKLRYSASFLLAKYEMEYARLAAIETRGFVGQTDLDELASFSARLRAEGRVELAEIGTRAESLRNRLTLLRQPAPSPSPSPASPSLGSSGPALLYAQYLLEFEELRKFDIGQAMFLKPEDIESVKSFSLKVMAQPYQDFQSLAAKAEEFWTHLTEKKNTYELEIIEGLHSRLRLKVDSGTRIDDVDIIDIESQISRLSKLVGPKYDEVKLRANTLESMLKSTKKTQETQLQLNALVQQYENLDVEYNKAIKTRKGGSIFGLGSILGGLASGAVSAYFNYLSVQAYAQYNGALTSAEAQSYRADAEEWSRLTLMAAGTGGGLFGLGTLVLMTRPKLKGYQDSLDKLDAMIEEIRSKQ